MSSGERPLKEVKFWTVAEVAEAMRTSRMTVYRLVHSGELPAIRVGRSFRVPAEAVIDYMSVGVAVGQVGSLVSHGHARGAKRQRPLKAAPDADRVPASQEVSLDTDPELVVIAHQAADRGQVVYLTEHGERLAAVVPADVAAELTALDDDERADLLVELLDTAAAYQGLEAIAAGESVVPWDDIKARLEL